MTFNSRSNIYVLAITIMIFLFHGCSKESKAGYTAPGFTLLDLSDQRVSLKYYNKFYERERLKALPYRVW